MGLLALAFFAGGLTAEVHNDITYKSGSLTEYEQTRCQLDLHLPNKTNQFATVVWFHGGSIKSGDKAGEIATGLAGRLNQHGIAVASVNYRLSPKVSFPAYLDDAAAAVGWVLQNINRFGGATNAVFVSGHSAGGYLAAMIGMDERFPRQYGFSPMNLAGVIPVAGQMITHSTVREERGIARSTPMIDPAAPSFHVRSNTPPFLNIVADADLPARLEENTYFVAAMKAAGNASVSFRKIPNRDHGSVAARISNENDPALQAIIEFIERARRE